MCAQSPARLAPRSRWCSSDSIRRKTMNVGMIVYSRTGNTRSVALELQKKLAGAGHTVALDRI